MSSRYWQYQAARMFVTRRGHIRCWKVSHLITLIGGCVVTLQFDW